MLLAAPRRFGKTGLMYRLLDEPLEPYRPIYVDVEDITSAGDFMVELLAALLRDRHFGRLLRDVRDGAKGFGRFLRNLPASVDVGGLKIELRERFVEAIFRSHETELSPEVRDAVLDRLGTPIPYLLAVLLTAILDRHRVGDGPVTVEMVDAAFADDLLGGATAAVFHHYRSRLDEYYTDAEARAAKAILGALSRADGPIERTTLYQLFLSTGGLEPGDRRSEEFLQLMTKLENDFYVSSADDSFEFYSRVLKLWWKARYGFKGV